MVKVLFFLVKVSQTCVNSHKYWCCDAQIHQIPCVRSSGSEPSPNGSPDPGRGSSLPEKVARLLFPSLQKHSRSSVPGGIVPRWFPRWPGCHQSHQNEDQRHGDLAPWTWTLGLAVFYSNFIKQTYYEKPFGPVPSSRVLKHEVMKIPLAKLNSKLKLAPTDSPNREIGNGSIAP